MYLKSYQKTHLGGLPPPCHIDHRTAPFHRKPHTPARTVRLTHRKRQHQISTQPHHLPIPHRTRRPTKHVPPRRVCLDLKAHTPAYVLRKHVSTTGPTMNKHNASKAESSKCRYSITDRSMHQSSVVKIPRTSNKESSNSHKIHPLHKAYTISLSYRTRTPENTPICPTPHQPTRLKPSTQKPTTPTPP